jgi:ABC-type polar amino acid transport system ATPase subunit
MITLSSVDKHYGDRHALRGVSLSVAPGEVVALIGPSGAGKSTLLRSIIGLETVTSGSIRCFEHVLPASPAGLRALRRDVGFLFQDFQLFPHLTALQNVSLSLVLSQGVAQQDADARALGVLERVDLKAHAHKHPGALSGGQKQRVALARALALDPRAILFDEPVSALDPECVLDVVDEIEALKAAQKAVIVTTHLLPFARRIATRIVFMVDGAIVESGTPDEMLNTPKSERLRHYLAHNLT